MIALKNNSILLTFIFILLFDMFVIQSSIGSFIYLSICLLICLVEITKKILGLQNKIKKYTVYFIFSFLLLIFSNIFGVFINFLHKEQIIIIAENLNIYKNKNGSYPNVIVGNKMLNKYLGYNQYYFIDNNNARIRFDQFNYSRRIINVDSMTISDHIEIY